MRWWRRVVTAGGLALALGAGALVAPTTTTPAQADEIDGPLVEILRTTSEAGFEHPSIGFTADDLENARTQVRAGVEPWASRYAAMTASRFGSSSWKPENMGADDQPLQQYNVSWMRTRAQNDGKGALVQAIQYLVTGEPVYRANALHAIRTYSNLDPEAYQYFTDAHIHTNGGLQQMSLAVEIIRYTEAVQDSLEGYDLRWGEEDTRKFKENVVDPHLDTFRYDKNGYYNQMNYSLPSVLAAAIATDDAELYAERVERFTVNAGFDAAGDWNGSLSALFREIPADNPENETGETYVQHMEMGRDQPHSHADVLNLASSARYVADQGDLVDPVDGTLSTSADAVSPYDFADRRLLAGADYYYGFDAGLEVPWTDVAGDGVQVSQDGRGRALEPINEVYFQYKYELGVDVEQVAPGVTYAQQQSAGTGYWSLSNGKWAPADLSLNHGWEYWLSLPADLDEQDRQVPQRPETTDTLVGRIGIPLNDGATFERPTDASGEGGSATLDPAQEGAIAVNKLMWLYRAQENRMGIRVRSEGGATLSLHRTADRDPFAEIVVPDTGGEWRWVTVEVGTDTVPSTTSGDAILFLRAQGEDAAPVEIDRIKPIDYEGMEGRLSPPLFAEAAVRTAAVAGDEFAQSFVATDSVADDAVEYAIDGAPEGATVDDAGLVTFTPADGSQDLSFTVTAQDGESISGLPVEVTVAPDRESAVEGLVALLGDEDYTRASTAAVTAATQAALAEVAEADGPRFAVLLEELRLAVAGAELVNPQLSDGSLDFTELVTSPRLTPQAIASLTDDDAQTYWGNFAHQYVDLDLGPKFRARADAFGFLARPLLPFRTTGANVYGSNDGRTWDLLTERTVVGDVATIQDVPVVPERRDDAYRFLRIQADELPPPNDPRYPGMFSVSDFRIYGERVEVTEELDSVALTSAGSDVVQGRVAPGDEVTLSFTSEVEISDVAVTLGGEAAPVEAGESGSWSATAAVSPDVEQGAYYPFTIDYTTADGEQVRTEATSDRSNAWVSTDEGSVDSALQGADVSGIALDPATIQAANTQLFNGRVDKTTVAPDRDRAAIVWDLGEEQALRFGGADVLLQQDNFGVGNVDTLRFEGSNDGESWVPLTRTPDRALDWQRLDSLDTDGSYRYLRIFNELQIALAEIRVRGEVVEPTVEDVTRPRSTLITPTTGGPSSQLDIQVDATDDVGLERVVANVYRDGTLVRSTQSAANGATSASHTASLTLPDGSYTIRYNARDTSGNVSRTQEHAVTVDASGPSVTVKPGAEFTVGDAETGYERVSFKLFDAGQIDGFVLNDHERDLTNDRWSDINGVRPGTQGAVVGENTLVVRDVAGNTTTVTFTLTEN